MDTPEQDADVFFLFDRSGSMASCLKDAQGGYDTFIQEQQKAKSNRYVSLWDFDTDHRLIYGLTLAEKIPVGVDRNGKRIKDSYVLSPRGSTALLDAITRLVAYAETHRDDARKTIIVILTDGEENMSKEATTKSVETLLKKKQEDGWIVIYLGANQDAITVAGKMGISMASAATMDMANVAIASAGTASMMSAGLRGGSYAYTDNQRKSFTDTGTAEANTVINLEFFNDRDEYEQEPMYKF